MVDLVNQIREGHGLAGDAALGDGEQSGFGLVDDFVDVPFFVVGQLGNLAGSGQHPAAEYYGISAIPTVILVGKDGKPTTSKTFGASSDAHSPAIVATDAHHNVFESPSPDELADAYLDVARVLRSQYALTLDVDVPLDGTIHTLVLQATTETGETNEGEITFRAPIPIPLVSLPSSLQSDGPISEITEIIPEIKADSNI